MKILILSGYAGHTIRTHNVCRLLKNELQIKVTKYVYGKNNYKWLKNQKSSIYDKIFCVEHIYEEIENSLDNIEQNDLDFLNYLVKKKNKNLTKILYIDRELVQHTHHNFHKKKFKQEEINSFFTKIYKHVESSLDDIDLVYTYHASSLISYILSEICKEKNIKFRTIRNDGITNNFFFPDSNSALLPRKTIEYFKKSSVDQASLKIIEKYIEDLDNDIIKKSIVRGQVIRNKILKLNFTNFYRFCKNFFIKDDYKPFLRKNNFQRIYEQFYIRYNIIRSTNLFKSSINKNFKILYLPLQKVPETQILQNSVKFYDPLSLIKSLSLFIPPNWKLVVKEHPVMIGKRSYKLYQEINKIYNVDLIDQNYSSLKIIKESDAVITTSGTAGLQSYALGKKTILLGDIFYEVLDGIVKLNEVDELYKVLKDIHYEDINQSRSKNKIQLAKLISAIQSQDYLNNKNDEFWTQKTFEKGVISFDKQLCKAIKSFLTT